MSVHLISKSSFIKGLQCHKALYLYKNHYHLRDKIPQERQALFNRGHEVGLLARKLFPGGVDASPGRISKFSESIEKTEALLRKKTKVIYEPAFLFNGVLAAVDILVARSVFANTEPVNDSNSVPGWIAFEVKSSAKISSVYILDATLQYWVIKNSGVEISDFFIVNLNKSYVRHGTLEYEKLFSRTSVMEDIIKMQPFVEESISIQKDIISRENIPDIPVSAHCFEPHPCDFMGYCWKNVSEKSIIVPSSARENIKLIEKDIKTGNDPDEIKLNDSRQIHRAPEKDIRPYINLPEIKKFLEGLKFPLCFVDFEVIMPAIPLFNGTSPFQNIPFQYSIYKKTQPFLHGTNNIFYPDSSKHIEYSSFLAEAGYDPRKDFIERFLNDSKGDGSILVYDSVLERSVLNALKRDFPQYEIEIEQRLERITDLMLPFKNKFMYSIKMGGNFSLKHVADAFLPEINFEKMKISNGRLSMIAFENLQKETDLVKIIETREALEEYCRKDTESMLEIVNIMEKLANTPETDLFLSGWFQKSFLRP